MGLTLVLERTGVGEQRSSVVRRWLGAAVVTVVVGTTGCCPPPEADEPVSPVPPPVQARTIPPTRTIPPAKLGRFEVQPPAPKAKEPNREMLKEPPLVPPIGPKVEDGPRPREQVAPREPRPMFDTLPENVVLELLETYRASFVRCFKLAIKRDPLTSSFKVKVHVELDYEGAIMSTKSDAIDQELGACLVRATGWMKFPASGKPVAVDLPLFYRAE